MTTTPPPRYSAQVPPWSDREAFLADLERAPWSELARSVLGRPIEHAVLSVRGDATSRGACPPQQLGGGFDLLSGSVPIGLSIDRGFLAETGASPPARASLLVVGGVHGDEPASGVAVARFFETCDERISDWRESRDLLEAPAPASVDLDLDLVFVPILNPDGFAAHTKDNARGVDLNRNFPTRNFGEARRPGYDPGALPGSEPETRALLDLVASLAPLRAVVAVHQPFACVNYDGPAADLAAAVGRAAAMPVRADLGYPTPGSMGTWFGVERSVPILTLELGGGAPEDEWPRAKAALAAALAFCEAR